MTEQEQIDIFTANLKKYMMLGGYTQREVAKAIDVNPQTFNTWMTGKHIPRMDKIQRLADFFGIRKSELVDVNDNLEDETLEQAFARRQDLRVLFMAVKDLSPQDIEMVIRIAGIMKN